MKAPSAHRVVFREGRKVILRPIEKSDVSKLTRWINDPEVNSATAAYLPASTREEKNWVEELAKKKETDIVLGIETTEGALVGVTGLHRISWKDRTAVTGTIIGEKDCWGKGYGTEAKMLLLDYAFNTLNLRKICSTAFAMNERSLRMSQRCGYREEGRRKEQFFKNGQYHDEVLLAVFKKDWLPLWEKYQKGGLF